MWQSLYCWKSMWLHCFGSPCEWIMLSRHDRERQTRVFMSTCTDLHQMRYCLNHRWRIVVRWETDKERSRSVFWARFKVHWKMIPFSLGSPWFEGWLIMEAKWSNESFFHSAEILWPIVEMNSHTCSAFWGTGRASFFVMTWRIHAGLWALTSRKDGEEDDTLERSKTYLHLYPLRDALIELYGCWLLCSW